MPNRRLRPDPHDFDRIFPDHAYAPGYEPAPRERPPEEERERVIAAGEMIRFAFAALMVLAGMAALSGLMLAA